MAASRCPAIGGHQDGPSTGLSLGQRLREASDSISGRLPSVWIRKVTICNQCSELAERRCDADAPIGVGRPPDLDAGRVCIAGDHLALGEGGEASNERGNSVSRHVDAVFRNGL
jgi:hypothetical protein